MTGVTGDSDYDHIVTVTSLTSNHPLTDPSYYGDDQLGFTDHGLWDDGKEPSYYFQYGFDAVQATRQGANAASAGIYSLANDGSNYGIALLGVADAHHDTLPVRIDTNLNYEDPSIASKSNQRPNPMPLALTITVSNLETHVPYVLYRYNSLVAVPESAFNANGSKAEEKIPFEISTGSTYTFTQMIQSNDQVIYRCVKASAP
jgi:hypothetical protein